MTAKVSGGKAKKPWTEAQIREVLAIEHFDYQAIALPHGLSTPGYDRKKTADLIFEGDWRGQSVIDVGCYFGYFLIEAKARGAGRCLGLDLFFETVRRAKLLADMNGQDVEFRQGDIDEGPLPEKFDNVLCLNVLHHLKEPLLGLSRLVQATRRRLVLEVASIGFHDRRKLGLGWFQAMLVRKLPIIFVGRGASDEGIKQYYLTANAVENELRYRYGCFASVKVKPSGFKNRFVVIAEKRRIDTLVVMAGPGGAALQGEIADLRNGTAHFVKLPAMKNAPVLRATDYHVPQESEQTRLVFDYDLLRPAASNAITYSHDPALDVLDTAAKVTILTLWEEPQALVNRLKKELAGATSRREKKFLRRTVDAFSSPAAALQYYSDWHRQVGGKGEHFFIVREGKTPRLVKAEQWLKRQA